MRFEATSRERRECRDRRHEERRITRVVVNEERRVGDRRLTFRRSDDLLELLTVR